MAGGLRPPLGAVAPKPPSPLTGRALSEMSYAQSVTSNS